MRDSAQASHGSEDKLCVGSWNLTGLHCTHLRTLYALFLECGGRARTVGCPTPQMGALCLHPHPALQGSAKGQVLGPLHGRPPALPFCPLPLTPCPPLLPLLPLGPPLLPLLPSLTPLLLPLLLPLLPSPPAPLPAPQPSQHRAAPGLDAWGTDSCSYSRGASPTGSSGPGKAPPLATRRASCRGGPGHL